MNANEFIIQFHFQKKVVLRERRRMKQFIAEKLLKEGRKCGSEINFVFCSDDELLDINRKHLDHDYFTDIITFDLSQKGSCMLVSDIYISVDRVKDNAKTEGVLIGNELQRVIFHGLLHLIGYKDKSVGQEREMRRMEEQWMEDFSLYTQ
ncbi:rRNA maturation RNase YbeY [Niabella hibiscisoli]|uniref:rRNA maturation RNase YbeY n=1 Tax=Niabella hibiscisoli TaxID=1825928 RepID=UPI001F0D3203|nr:rRNA maturation RNase YbeY [Niabella hibiscisoli]MCH5716186.1 rRNA maturation RNase YbeY [Niabella hibiscisoli]